WTTETGWPPGVVSDGGEVTGSRAGGCEVAILSASSRGWIVAGRLPVNRGRVVFLDVLPHHPPGGKPAPGQSKRVAHLLDPAQRGSLRSSGVVQGDDLLLQQPVEIGRIGRVGVLVLRNGSDGPAAQSIVALLPPSVEGAELGDTIEPGLHAAGT